jgi:hypothetical protein
MENQSGPFNSLDTIVAIILSMHALGLGVLLSREFREADGMLCLGIFSSHLNTFD